MTALHKGVPIKTSDALGLVMVFGEAKTERWLVKPPGEDLKEACSGINYYIENG